MRVAALAALSAVSIAASPATSAAQDVNGTLIVLRAKNAADIIHDWHDTGAGFPETAADYCRRYKDFDGILDQLRNLLGNPASPSDVDPNGTSGGVSNKTILDTYFDLNSELAEEDDINDDWGFSCDPPKLFYRGLTASNSGGFFLGLQLSGDTRSLTIAEYLALTGAQTNNFDKSGTGIGLGFKFGYTFKMSDYRVSPFISVDIPGQQTLAQTFAGGTYINSKVNWTSTLGANFGVMVVPSTQLYGILVLSLMNQKTEINFGGPISSDTKTVPGLTVGGGIDYRFYKSPFAVYTELQYTMWQKQWMNSPAASPAFNYAFANNTVRVLFGAKYNWFEPGNDR
jgi:hypothetical protein